MGGLVLVVPDLIYCEEAKELLGLFGEAIRDATRTQEEQIMALVAGDDDLERFDALIHMANERKRAAKYAYLKHLETHRCSTMNPISEEVR